MVGKDAVQNFFWLAQDIPPMAIDADRQVELGLEMGKVAAVFRAVHAVRLERVETLAVECLAEQRHRIGTAAIGAFKAIDKERPVDFFVVVAGQVEEISGKEAAADVDVKLAGFGSLEGVLRHPSLQRGHLDRVVAALVHVRFHGLWIAMR